MTVVLKALFEAIEQLLSDEQERVRQLSDVDLQIAALAHRLDGTVITTDVDFDVLPIKREDWHNR